MATVDKYGLDWFDELFGTIDQQHYCLVIADMALLARLALRHRTMFNMTSGESRFLEMAELCGLADFFLQQPTE